MKALKCAKLSTAGDITCVGGLKMLWNCCCCAGIDCCIDDCTPIGCCIDDCMPIGCCIDDCTPIDCCIDDCMLIGCCAMMKGVGCAPAIKGGAMFIMSLCCGVTEDIVICVFCIACGRLIAVVLEEVCNRKSRSLFTAATEAGGIQH